MKNDVSRIIAVNTDNVTNKYCCIHKSTELNYRSQKQKQEYSENDGDDNVDTAPWWWQSLPISLASPALKLG